MPAPAIRGTAGAPCLQHHWRGRHRNQRLGWDISGIRLQPGAQPGEVVPRQQLRERRPSRHHQDQRPRAANHVLHIPQSRPLQQLGPVDQPNDAPARRVRHRQDLIPELQHRIVLCRSLDAGNLGHQPGQREPRLARRHAHRPISAAKLGRGLVEQVPPSLARSGQQHVRPGAHPVQQRRQETRANLSARHSACPPRVTGARPCLVKMKLTKSWPKATRKRDPGLRR